MMTHNNFDHFKAIIMGIIPSNRKARVYSRDTHQLCFSRHSQDNGEQGGTCWSVSETVKASGWIKHISICKVKSEGHCQKQLYNKSVQSLHILWMKWHLIKKYLTKTRKWLLFLNLSNAICKMEQLTLKFLPLIWILLTHSVLNLKRVKRKC